MNAKQLQIAAGTFAAALCAVAAMTSLASAAAGGPTVTLSSTASSTTNLGTIPVTATFSEDVSGFGTSSITVTNGTASNVTGTSSVYTFDVSPSAEGTTTVMIPDDAVVSVASSTGNQASNTLSFVYDTSAPVIALTSGIASSTASTTPSFTFTSSEAGTIAFTGGCSASSTSAVAGSNTVTLHTLSSGNYSCSVTVEDAAGNVSNAIPLNFSVVTSAPVISNVNVTNVGTSTATVTWNTDVAANSQVNYGTTTSYGSSTALDTTATTSHSVSLSGLSEATFYHIQVASGNVAGTSTAPDVVFVTESTASTTPLSITSIDAVRTQAVADGSFSDGWEWVLHFVVPSVETNFSMRFSDFASLVGSSTIPAASNIRYYSEQSSNASTTASAIVESDNGYGGTLNLTGDTSPAPGRQIDVHVQVAVPNGTPTGQYTTTFGARSLQ